MDARQMTPEALALSLARKEKKLKQALEAAANPPPALLLTRAWLTITSQQPKSSNRLPSHQVKILTWNLLAQCLIRRELFPTSDCLKVALRERCLHEEILKQNSDILCLQEVDRLERLLPILENAGYFHHYASGPKKRHGCMIAFKKDLYSLVSVKVVFYDDEHAGKEGGPPRIGSSFKTRNIANLVALRSKDNEAEGIIVATTHLFWHPRSGRQPETNRIVRSTLISSSAHEELDIGTRQLAILIRETTAFREQLSVNSWPCVIAGDFNFGPSDPAYSLIAGDSLLPLQREMIHTSRVVHATRDPSILTSTSSTVEHSEDDEPEDVDPDCNIINARPATKEDGLLDIPEIVEWFSTLPRLCSAYNEGLYQARRLGAIIPTYGTRVELPPGRQGATEPEYTSYTHYWKAVLDYIFFLNPPERPIEVTGLLTPLKSEDLEPGLPQKRVSGSDHTSLVAEMRWEIK